MGDGDWLDSYDDGQGNVLHLAHDGLSYQLWSAHYQQWMGYDSSTGWLFPNGAYTSAKDAYEVWYKNQAPTTPEVQAFMDSCETLSDAMVAVGTAVTVGALTVDQAAHVVELVAECAVPLALLTGVGLAVDLAALKLAITTEHIAEAIMTEAVKVTWDGVSVAALRYDAQSNNQIPTNAQSVLGAARNELNSLADTWHQVVSNLGAVI
jgi:hypothetical protein